MFIHSLRHNDVWCIHIDRTETRNAIDDVHARALYDAVIAFEMSDAKVAVL